VSVRSGPGRVRLAAERLGWHLPELDRWSPLRAFGQLAPVAASSVVGGRVLAGRDRLGAAVLVMGALAATLLLIAAVRGRGAVRWSWAAVTVAELLWVASLLGIVRSWPGWLTWGVLRPAGYLIVLVGLIGAPGVRRGLRDWGLLLMDGWLIAASGVEITWVALTYAGSDPGDVLGNLPPSLLWAASDVLACTVVTGLAVRSRRHSRGSVALVGLSTLLAVSADLALTATRDPGLGVVLWLVMLACLSAATLGRRLDIWAGSAPDPDALQLARVAHVAVLPGLLAAAVAQPPDVVTLALAFSLLAVLGAEILLGTMESRVLWTRTRQQAERLDAVLRGSRDAIIQLAPGGWVQYANPACEPVLGHAPEVLLGRRIAELVHPDDRPGAIAAIHQLEGGAEGIRLLGRMRRADGRWRHVESTVSRQGTDQQPALVLIARDVEDRVRLENELRIQADTDSLTGMLTRRAFLTALGNDCRPVRRWCCSAAWTGSRWSTTPRATPPATTCSGRWPR
jgi:PAS domain S-box-containing protein